MNAPSVDASERRGFRFLRPQVLIPLGFWAAGMILAHSPMIFSGLGRIQQDRVDSRMIHYLMEHGYRWVSGDPHHLRFWDPPIFYPARNMAAYSETTIGTAPIYWFWRAVGVPADPSYGLWLLAVSTLNFLASFLFLRRILNRTPTASGYGAFLFSFASMRLANLGHPQLFAGFYVIAVLYALVRLLEQTDRRKAAPWAALLAVSFAAQVYSCFYLAWFLALALGLALLSALALPSLRAGTLAVLRRHAALLGAGVVAAGLALIPFLRHSFQAAATTGYRPYDEVEMFLPRVLSWFYFGSNHWLYGGLAGAALYSNLPIKVVEQIALGVVTPVLAGMGLWRMRTTPLGKLLAIVTLTLLLATLYFPGGASLWGLIYLVVPGAGAIRAVSRVAYLLLFAVSAGAATMIDESRWKKPLLIAAALLAVLEQGRSRPSLDRAETRSVTVSIARRFDPAAEAVFVTCREPLKATSLLEQLPPCWHLQVMAASLDAGVPTINGYSGWSPPDWPFSATVVVADRESEANVERLLQEWCRRNGIDRNRVQWIRDIR